MGLASLAVNRVLEANFNSRMLATPQVLQYNMGQRYAIAFITGATNLQAPQVLAPSLYVSGQGTPVLCLVWSVTLQIHHC